MDGIAQALYDTGLVVQETVETTVTTVTTETTETTCIEATQADVAQQSEAVGATQDKMVILEEDTVELARAVKAGRYARLAAHAATEGWTLDKVPPKAERDPEVRAWWNEWVQLTAEMEAVDE